MQRSILDPPDIDDAVRDQRSPMGISDSEDLEEEAPTGLAFNWSLLRKFQVFWPPGASAPPVFPWLGQLVGRKKAYYWVSQFAEEFDDLDIQDHARILGFISRSLTSDDPVVAEKKSCCGGGGGGPGPLPPGPDDPGWGPLPNYEVKFFCGPPECPPGMGMEAIILEDGTMSAHTDCYANLLCAELEIPTDIQIEGGGGGDGGGQEPNPM